MKWKQINCNVFSMLHLPLCVLITFRIWGRGNGFIVSGVSVCLSASVCVCVCVSVSVCLSVQAITFE